MRYVLSGLCFFMLVGCGTSPIREVDSTVTNEYDRPPVGAVETRQIGEVLLAKGTQSLREAIEIVEETKFNKKPGESSIMTCALSVMPEKAYKKGVYETEDVNAECYGPVQFRRTLADGSTNWNCPGNPLVVGDICKEQNGKIFLAIVASRVYLEQDFENIRFVKSPLEDKENFVQEIVYSGKSAGRLKFVYREYSDSLIKPDFFQDFEFDSATGLVQFKGAELKVIEATNEKVTYEVIRSFR